MAQKRLREFHRDRIPHSYDSVVAAAGQMPAVWSKGHALDTALVLAEGADFPAGSRIEEDDILVVSPDSHSELSATRLVGYAADAEPDAESRCPDRRLQLAGPPIPDSYPSAETGRGQLFSIRAKGHGSHSVRVCAQRANLLTCFCVPNSHSLIVAGGGDNRTPG